MKNFESLELFSKFFDSNVNYYNDHLNSQDPEINQGQTYLSNKRRVEEFFDKVKNLTIVRVSSHVPSEDAKYNGEALLHALESSDLTTIFKTLNFQLKLDQPTYIETIFDEAVADIDSNGEPYFIRGGILLAQQTGENCITVDLTQLTSETEFSDGEVNCYNHAEQFIIRLTENGELLVESVHGEDHVLPISYDTIESTLLMHLFLYLAFKQDGYESAYQSAIIELFEQEQVLEEV